MQKYINIVLIRIFRLRCNSPLDQPRQNHARQTRRQPPPNASPLASTHPHRGPLHSAQRRHPIRHCRQRCTERSIRHPNRIQHNQRHRPFRRCMSRMARQRGRCQNTRLFRRHFRAADQDRRHSTTTSASAGYHGANAALNQPSAPTKATSHPTPATNTPSAPGATPRGPDQRPNTSYCWSHGFLKNQKHNSLTCKFKKEGHQDTATGTNLMGGATGIFTPRTNPVA